MTLDEVRDTCFVTGQAQLRKKTAQVVDRTFHDFPPNSGYENLDANWREEFSARAPKWRVGPTWRIDQTHERHLQKNNGTTWQHLFRSCLARRLRKSTRQRSRANAKSMIATRHTKPRAIGM